MTEVVARPPRPKGQLCPVCQQPPMEDNTKRAGRRIVSDLMCAEQHVWTVEWVG